MSRRRAWSRGALRVARSAGGRPSLPRQATVRSCGYQGSAGPAPAVIAARRSTAGTRAPVPMSWPRTRRRARVRERPCRRRRASPGSRPVPAPGHRRVACSPGPAGWWASVRATISLPTRVGASGATAYATKPPRLKPNRPASAIPNGRATRRRHRRSPRSSSRSRCRRRAHGPGAPPRSPACSPPGVRPTARV